MLKTSVRYQTEDRLIFWRKTQRQQHLGWTSGVRLLQEPKVSFAIASYRQVGYWWKNDSWCVIFCSPPVWGTHYLLIHTRAASQFEENKHGGFGRQHHFYFMTVPRQLFPDWGKLSAAWHLVRRSTLLAPDYMYIWVSILHRKSMFYPEKGIFISKCCQDEVAVAVCQ